MRELMASSIFPANDVSRAITSAQHSYGSNAYRSVSPVDGCDG